MVFAILKNSIQKEIRSKVLLFLFICTILMILIAHGIITFFFKNAENSEMANLFVHNTITVFLYFINIWNWVLASVLGVNSVESDREYGILGQVMSFPISRISYLNSRILGTLLMVVLYYLASLITAYFVFRSQGDIQIGSNIFMAFGFSLCEILSMILISILWSLVFPKILAFITTIGTFFIIWLSNSHFKTQSLTEMFSNFSISKSVGVFFHLMFPRLGVLSEFSKKMITGENPDLILWKELVHFGLSFSLIYGVTFLIFKRKSL